MCKGIYSGDSVDNFSLIIIQARDLSCQEYDRSAPPTGYHSDSVVYEELVCVNSPGAILRLSLAFGF